jgi:CRISPR-associated protein Cas2
MVAFGWSMQYSVFICDLDEIEMLMLKSAILGIIQTRADSVAVIRLGSPTERGRGCFEFLGVPPGLPTSGPVIL